MSNAQFIILIVVILVATGTFWRFVGGAFAGLAIVAILAVPVIGGIWLYDYFQEKTRKHQAEIAAAPYCVGFETNDADRIEIVRMNAERFSAWLAGNDRKGGFELYGKDCRNMKKEILQ